MTRETSDEERIWNRAVRAMPALLRRLGPTIGAPAEYAGHRTFILAFKRGVLMGMNPQMPRCWRWYTGDETHAIYERGWRAGRERLKRSGQAQSADAVGQRTENPI